MRMADDSKKQLLAGTPLETTYTNLDSFPSGNNDKKASNAHAERWSRPIQDACSLQSRLITMHCNGDH